MRPSLRVTRKLFVALLAVTLAACGSDEKSDVEIVAIGPPGSPFVNSGRLPGPAQLLRGATAEGLVGLNGQGLVIAGVADRWIVTDDGLSYIFRLRDAEWPDGDPITAESARIALRQAVAKLRGTPMAPDLGALEEIRVMTGRVIELRLSRPQPQLLMLLAQPELGLLRSGRGTGPMRFDREGNHAILTPIAPEKRGLPAVEDWTHRVRQLRFSALPAERALEQFNHGQINAVLGGGFEHFPLVDAAGLSRGAIRLDPVMGLFGLIFAHDDGFLAAAENREAVAMTIDRGRLAASFRVGGWLASNRIFPAGLEDEPANMVERWGTLNIADRRAVATARVTRWRSARTGPIRLRIALPAGPGADRLFANLADDLGQAGLVAVRAGLDQPADLRLVDAVARYPRAVWFFNQLSCASRRGLCNSDVDRDLAAAQAETDQAARAQLAARAAIGLIDSNVFIPFGPPIRWSLVRGDITGFYPNRLGYHPLMPLALRPR
jgi:ABC-type transport system substrate-binding protein